MSSDLLPVGEQSTDVAARVRGRGSDREGWEGMGKERKG